MYHSILVPFDNSEHARNALKSALEIAKLEEDSRITVLYVVDMPDFGDPTFAMAVQMAGMTSPSAETALEMQREFYEKKRESLIATVAPLVGEANNVVYRTGSGKPQDVISDMANNGSFDLVVMGCRGLGALRGALGSVSYAVLRSVDVPVLVMK
ncbi:MAG: universal stress protein [Eggerthellaceae bacterium]|nr:universal stress protein [Eggerthellaceae bacterium]